MLTAPEIQAIITLLNRVDLKGQEALPVAQLQLKLQQFLQQEMAKDKTLSSIELDTPKEKTE